MTSNAFTYYDAVDAAVDVQVLLGGNATGIFYVTAISDSGANYWVLKPTDGHSGYATARFRLPGPAPEISYELMIYCDTVQQEPAPIYVSMEQGGSFLPCYALSPKPVPSTVDGFEVGTVTKAKLTIITLWVSK